MDEIATAVKSGTSIAQATWESFLSTWGDHPNTHKELREHIIRLRKSGLLGKHRKTKTEKIVNVSLTREIHTHYKKLARQKGKSLETWIKDILRKETIL